MRRPNNVSTEGSEALVSGREYLESIKKELQTGRHQHRVGENILAEFGYVRRRRSAVDEINFELKRLGLCADPPISPEMPLRSPRIRFSLVEIRPEPPAGRDQATEKPESESLEDGGADAATDAATVTQAAASSFRIAELAAADHELGWVSPNASVAEAYTKMSLRKYSQLLVAGNSRPRAQDVKGIISYKSIAKASLISKPSQVADCLERVPIVRNDTDLSVVVKDLVIYDVVLVEGPDHKVQGIVTAWDLASEFAQLVETFKRIGEVEGRLRVLLNQKLTMQRVQDFLADHARINGGHALTSIDELTIGDLIRVIQHPDHWSSLQLSAIDKDLFVDALDQMRMFRNRLMHFRDPLNDEEVRQLTHLCELVREIPI